MLAPTTVSWKPHRPAFPGKHKERSHQFGAPPPGRVYSLVCHPRNQSGPTIRGSLDISESLLGNNTLPITQESMVGHWVLPNSQSQDFTYVSKHVLAVVGAGVNGVHHHLNNAIGGKTRKDSVFAPAPSGCLRVGRGETLQGEKATQARPEPRRTPLFCPLRHSSAGLISE